MAIDIKLGMKRKFDYPKSIKEVDELSGEEFERFVFRYLKEYQSYEGQITEKNDYGVDILLWYPDNKSNRYGVQCKRYGPKTVLTENDLMKMQKDVDHYGLRDPKTSKPNLTLFTSAEKQQVSTRGLAYIENEKIEAYYRNDIIDVLKHLEEGLGIDHKKVELFGLYLVKKIRQFLQLELLKSKNVHQISKDKFTMLIRDLRKKIAMFAKIDKFYSVFTNETFNENVEKFPRNENELLEIREIEPVRIGLWGQCFLSEINLVITRIRKIVGLT